MAVDLTSINAKLRRASEHTETLNGSVRKWMEDNPYRYITKVNADSTSISLFIKKAEGPEAPREQWALMFGDAIHNLRSALDHLIYAIAVEQSKKDPPPSERSLGFPITNTAKELAQKRSRIESSVLNENVWRAIESLQPYKRQHPSLPPLLSILSEFDNADKHRLLKIALATPYELRLDVKWDSPSIQGRDIGAQPWGSYGELQDGMELYRIDFDQPLQNLRIEDVNAVMVFSVWHGKRDLAGPPWSDRTAIDAILRELTLEVNGVIQTVLARMR